MFGLAILVLTFGGLVGWAAYGAFASRGLVGVDLSLFSELGRRFAETGTQYAPFQLAGPYQYDAGSGSTDVSAMPGLYPPLAGPMFALVRFLPKLLWWIIPLGLTTWLIIRWHPAPWMWPVMALATLSPNTWGSLIAGNTTMWIVLFVAAGLRWGWPAALIVIKPTFLPLTLVGWRSRWMWIGLAASLGLTVALASELGRYVVVIGNVRGASPLYSLADLPFVLIPVWAYIAQSTVARPMRMLIPTGSPPTPPEYSR
jgi:hypothetical protein